MMLPLLPFLSDLTYSSTRCFPFSSPTYITSAQRMHRSSCRVITGCQWSTPIPLLYLKALFSPLCVALTHQSLSFFERALRLTSTFPLACLSYFNPFTPLEKGSWKSFSRSHNPTPNLKLSRKALILYPPKPFWSTPSSYSISHQFSFPCSRNDPHPFATPPLVPTYPPYLIATSLPGLMARFLKEDSTGIHIRCTKSLS